MIRTAIIGTSAIMNGGKSFFSSPVLKCSLCCPYPSPFCLATFALNDSQAIPSPNIITVAIIPSTGAAKASVPKYFIGIAF